jgi:chromate transporter
MPVLLTLFLSMLLVGAISFGGGYAVIPLLQYQVVTRLHLISSAEFVDAIAVGQMTPGPVLIMAAFIGYQVAGWAGAIVAIVGLFAPSFFAVLALSSLYERVHDNPRVEQALEGVCAAVVGLLAATIIDLVPKTSIALPSIVIAAVVCLLVLRTKIEPAILVVASGVIGWLLFR